MRIWLITVGEPLPLPGSAPRLLRTGLLATELSRQGHDVVWWTSRVDLTAKRFFPGDGTPLSLSNRLEIRFLRGRLYRSNVSWQRLLNHRQVAADFRSQAPGVPAPDVILCSFPTIELSREAVAYGQVKRIPVVLDIRDLWPDALLAAVPAVLEPLGRLALAPMYREARRALQAATGIIGISEGYLAWARREAHRAPRAEDVVIPLGYPRPEVTADALAGAWRDLEVLGVRRDTRMVLFVGSFGRSYDLAPLFEAARTFADDKSVQFVIAGDGERGAEWRDAARGAPNVVLTGWVDGPKVAALLDGASVGVAAYAEGALQGLPNKLLEYLAAGIPVVSSLKGEAVNLLARCECGLTYDAREPATLVAALRTLLTDSDTRLRMGRQARATYVDQFTSESVTQRLIAYLDAAARRASAA